MKKTLKKGFTIIELVIVIAVIAILAAVLIPTFVSVVNKANVSNDTALVRNLNSALISEESAGNKPATMTDVIKIAEEYGYNVENLQTKASGYKLLWNQETNRFYVQKDGKEITTNPEVTNTPADGYTYWEISSEISTKHSTYLGNYSGAAEITDLKTGLDVGNNTVTSVSYVGNGDQHVVIRTNDYGTKLTVNAPNDEIDHYGKVQSVDIIKVKKSTYNEYGCVLGNINVAYGYVSLKDGSSVSNVVAKSLTSSETTVTPSAGDVKVVVSENAKVGMVISEISSVTVPVEGEKAAEVPSIVKNEEQKAYIGSTGYANYCVAAKAAKDGDTITLTSSVEHYLSYISADNVALDLNGYTFTILTTAIIENNITIKNGSLKYEGANGIYEVTAAIANPAIKVNPYKTLTLDGVTLTSGSYGISASDNAACIKIVNSTIEASGQAIATNNAESANTRVEIISSVIRSTAYTYSGTECDDTVAVLINNSGSVEITDSLIEGGAQGLVVRAGSATVTDSEIKARLGSECSESKYQSGAWNNGNNIMHGTLIVGDWNSSSYNTNATCILKSTKITSDNASWSRALIVLSQDGSCKTIFNYDEACGISGYYIHDITTVGIKKGAIEVNGNVVRVAE